MIKSKKKLDEIKTREENIDEKHLIYKTNKYTFTFQQLETIRSFGHIIFNDNITLGNKS